MPPFYFPQRGRVHRLTHRFAPFFYFSQNICCPFNRDLTGFYLTGKKTGKNLSGLDANFPVRPKFLRRQAWFTNQ
jgi:hypothetical protein